MPEPVTLAEVKGRLGVRTDHRDGEIEDLIPAAREKIEEWSQRILVRREVVVPFPLFVSGASFTLLGVLPVVSLTEVRAYNAAGEAIIVPARLIQHVPWARVFPAVGAAWPSNGDPTLVSVVVQAGFLPEEVPAMLKQAMYLLIGHWFENHEAVAAGIAEVPLGVRDLCYGFRDEGFS